MTRANDQRQRASRTHLRQPIAPPTYYELKGGWFYLEDEESLLPREGNDAPRPHFLVEGRGTVGHRALLSTLNGWPESVHNDSIFPYLLEVDTKKQAASDFAKFVAAYYKSSCAIVYYPSLENFSVMLGSGGLINNYQTVATARHVVEGLDISRVFARFYNYGFKRNRDDRIVVLEDYIDVGIGSAKNAEGGLDASQLTLERIPHELSKKYMTSVSEVRATWGDGKSIPPGIMIDQTLPTGKYALFHFAYGQHRVSVGGINDPGMGAWLHSNIGIEAGPGASGAVPIQKNGDRVDGYGVSIYRKKITDGFSIQTERRIIPFWYFSTGLSDYDGITTPYKLGGLPLDDDYEFLSWALSKYALEARETKPGGHHYECQKGHSCHHIIPIRDLMYLWDYFDDKNNTYGRQDWGNFREDLGYLSPFSLNEHHKLPSDSRYWHHTDTQTRKFFAWAWWNLFRGPEDRSDDPRWDGAQNEKIRPLYFPKSLWDSVQSLFWRIQHLKELDQSPHPKAQMRTSVIDAENAIRAALEEVKESWKETFLKVAPYVLVRQYRADEWSQDAKTEKWALRSV